jgi:hypothetical protein
MPAQGLGKDAAATRASGHTLGVNKSLDHVVEETDRNRAQFEAFCRGLSPEELQRDVPGSTWLVRDFIAHLATIDTWVNDWFDHVADGRTWRPRGDDGGPFNIDTWNESRVQERRERSVEDLLTEAAANRAVLWATVERFSDEVLAQEFDFRGHNITFQRYLELWAGHDPAHSADMLRALPEQLKDPVIAAWVAPFVPAPRPMPDHADGPAARSG